MSGQPGSPALVLAHGGSGLEMWAAGALMLLVAVIVIGGIVFGMLTRYDDGAGMRAGRTTDPPRSKGDDGESERTPPVPTNGAAVDRPEGCAVWASPHSRRVNSHH